MCRKRCDELDYADLPEDPLTRLMMASDGVNPDDLRELLGSLRATLMARGPAPAPLHP